MPLKTLLIDNYDSYTYNLFQLISQVNQAVPDVISNDQLTWPALSDLLSAGTYDNIVISPGPGTPDCASDIGVCASLLKANLHMPILGVCMGMQALAVAHGASVQHAPEPIHGRLSHIHHTHHELFQDIPSGVGSGFSVVRYHSLAVNEASLPACLQATAWTCGSHQALRSTSLQLEGGQSIDSCAAHQVLQGIAHTSLPHYGVQFHPESIGTAYGRQLLQNFHNLTAKYRGMQLPKQPAAVSTGPGGTAFPPSPWQHAGEQASLTVRWQKLQGLLQQVGGAEALFMHLHGCQGAQDTFWLDSSASDRGRFSYFGGRGGPLWQRISYKLPAPPHPSTPHQPGASASPRQTHANQIDSPAHLSSISPELQLNASDTDRHQEADSHMGCSQHLPSLQQQEQLARAHQAPGTLTVEDSNHQITQHQLSVWDYLRQQLQRNRLEIYDETAQQLPFDFWGGYVGYLGYELKAECGGDNAHQAPTPDAAMFLADRLVALDHQQNDVYLLAMVETAPDSSGDAAQKWLSSTAQSIHAILPGPLSAHSPSPFSRHRGTTTQGSASSLADSSQTHQHMDTASSGAAMSEDDWSHIDQRGSFSSLDSCNPDSNAIADAGRQAEQQQETATQVHVDLSQKGTAAQQCTHQQAAPQSGQQASVSPHQQFRLARSKQQYLKDVEACQQALQDGESYEICLTTALVRPEATEALQLYRTLRKVNPAPHAAWLSFAADDLQICCSSPERFLRGGRGGVLEARPIKGTAPRLADPEEDKAAAVALAHSEKDQAENLMIVDLLRNDLSRVCQVGSVHVPGLMEVESFATVHQLVSTVRGQRQSHVSLVDAIRAAFPGGSMTGAPKVRSMQILDTLEKEARGIYSGSLGFIGFNDTCDLNIVIRTAVVHGGRTRIGAGGAIVVQSDTLGEYEEMRLKAMALLKAVSLSEGKDPLAAADKVNVGES